MQVLLFIAAKRKLTNSEYEGADNHSHCIKQLPTIDSAGVLDNSVGLVCLSYRVPKAPSLKNSPTVLETAEPNSYSFNTDVLVSKW